MAAPHKMQARTFWLRSQTHFIFCGFNVIWGASRCRGKLLLLFAHSEKLFFCYFFGCCMQSVDNKVGLSINYAYYTGRAAYICRDCWIERDLSWLLLLRQKIRIGTRLKYYIYTQITVAFWMFGDDEHSNWLDLMNRWCDVHVHASSIRVAIWRCHHCHICILYM